MAKKSGIHSSGILGIDTVMANLQLQLSKYKLTSMAGMIQAAIVIRRDMEATPPRIPVDKGILRASWYVVSSMTGITVQPKKGDTAHVQGQVSKAKASTTPLVIMGFSTKYSKAVHERTDPGINWKRPGSGAKFFEAALKRNERVIVEIIAKTARK